MRLGEWKARILKKKKKKKPTCLFKAQSSDVGDMPVSNKSCRILIFEICVLAFWERSCYGRSVTLVPCFVGYLCFTFCDTLFYKPGVVRSSRRLCAGVVWLEDSFFCHNHSWSPSCGLCESLRQAKNRLLKLYVGFFLRYLQKKKNYSLFLSLEQINIFRHLS